MSHLVCAGDNVVPNQYGEAYDPNTLITEYLCQPLATAN
jgi:hypothetical protein